MERAGRLNKPKNGLYSSVVAAAADDDGSYYNL
jgi:hypothetical protein